MSQCESNLIIGPSVYAIWDGHPSYVISCNHNLYTWQFILLFFFIANFNKNTEEEKNFFLPYVSVKKFPGDPAVSLLLVMFPFPQPYSAVTSVVGIRKLFHFIRIHILFSGRSLPLTEYVLELHLSKKHSRSPGIVTVHVQWMSKLPLTWSWGNCAIT